MALWNGNEGLQNDLGKLYCRIDTQKTKNRIFSYGICSHFHILMCLYVFHCTNFSNQCFEGEGLTVAILKRFISTIKQVLSSLTEEPFPSISKMKRSEIVWNSGFSDHTKSWCASCSFPFIVIVLYTKFSFVK